MGIQTTVEELHCIECDKPVTVQVMTDTSDLEGPELFQAPAGAFMTQVMLDPDSDDESWVVCCSPECGTEFLNTYDVEEEGEEG